MGVTSFTGSLIFFVNVHHHSLKPKAFPNQDRERRGRDRTGGGNTIKHNCEALQGSKERVMEGEASLAIPDKKIGWKDANTSGAGGGGRRAHVKQPHASFMGLSAVNRTQN